MYNFEQNYFFTDPDTSKDEKKDKAEAESQSEEEGEDEDDGDAGNLSIDNSEINTPINLDKKKPLQKKKLKDKPINYHKEEVLTEDQKAERIRQIHSKKFMNFPTNSGISGVVFKTKELFCSNNASKETKFVEEIDNQSVCTDVKNFMIGPVFGSNDKDTPCAIIQFINKLDQSDKSGDGKITGADEAKFKSMQNLLGMCIENTNEMSTTIKVSFDVQDVMKNIQARMQEEKEREETSNTDQLIKQLTDYLNVIRNQH